MAKLSYLYGSIAVDEAANLYIVDENNYRVRRVSGAGVITTAAGNGASLFSGDGGPATGAQFFHPSGLAIDMMGSLYIADTENYRVRKVTPGGIVSTVAGNGNSQGFSAGDGGQAISAALDRPAGVAVDKAGNLFGVTMQGGADNYGTIYKLTPKGVLTTLYNFTGGADGGYPSGGLDSDKAGNLYGATNLAGNGGAPFGTVFRLATDGSLTTLHTFSGGADGGFPEGDILQSGGKLYGTTSGGGSSSNYGVMYEVDAASGSETVLHTFADSDGANPEAGVTEHHGLLYGTASGGGAHGDGVVFSLKKK